MDIKDILSRSNIWGMEDLQGNFFIGVSIDKKAKYHGVFIRVPFNAAFINPLSKTYNTPQGMRENIYTTMIHEMAHASVSEHGEDHNAFMGIVAEYLADKGYLEPLRDNLLSVISKHWDTIQVMRRAYAKSSTRNIGKSFEESKKFKAGGLGDVEYLGGNEYGTLPVGGGQGRGTNLQRNIGGAEQREIGGGTEETTAKVEEILDKDKVKDVGNLTSFKRDCDACCKSNLIWKLE